MGKIKKLHFNEIIGWSSEGTTELYPITSTYAVFDEDGNCLADLLKNTENCNCNNNNEAVAYTLVSIYKITDTMTVPTLDRNSTNLPPDGWNISNPMTEGYVWVSQARTLKLNAELTFLLWEDDKVWSAPVCTGKIGNEDSSSLSKKFTVYRVGSSAEDVLVGAPLNNHAVNTFYGSYNFDTGVFTPPNGWETTPHPENVTEGNYLFYSDKIFLKQNDTNLWYEPPLMAFGKPAYRTTETKYVYASATNKEALSPLTGGSYNFGTKVLTPPTGWSISDTEVYESLQDGDIMFFAYRNFQSENDTSTWQGPFIMFVKADVSESDQVTVYAKYADSTTLWLNYCLNDTSTGKGKGTYNFDTKIVSLGGGLDTVWFLNVDDVANDEGIPIYKSFKRFYKNDSTQPWSIPTRYILPGEIAASSATNTTSFGAALYIATSKDTTSVTVPNYGSLPIYQQFDYATGLVIAADIVSNLGWDSTPEKASARYVGEGSPIIWVSYNNYLADFLDGEAISGTYLEMGWTTPITYLDIDNILEKASDEALSIADGVLQSAKNDLETAKNTLNTAKENLSAAQQSIANATAFLGEGYTSYINGSGGNLTLLMAQLATKDELTGYVSTSTYEQTSQNIKELVSAEFASEKDTLIQTAVENLSADKIELMVEEAIDGNVVTTALLEVKANEIKSLIASDLTDNTSTIGLTMDTIKALVTSAASSDIQNKIATGEISVSSNNISLVVAEGDKDKTGATNKAVFDLSIKDSTSLTLISSDKIVLSGLTIADAIAAKYLNIDNYTYLFGKYGSAGAASSSLITSNMNSNSYTASLNKYPIAWFGAGTSGMTAFNSDGSGYAAGGLLKWGKGIGTYNQSNTNNFGLEIEGHISARSGWIGRKYNSDGTLNLAGWEIGTLTEGSNTYAAIMGRDSSDNYLALTTEFLEAVYSGETIWQLNKNGSGSLAKGNINWSVNSSNGIATSVIKGTTYIEHAYIGSGSDTNYTWEIGTQSGHPFIKGACNTSRDTSNNEYYTDKLIISPDYINGGKIKASSDNPNSINLALPIGWFLGADGQGYMAKGNINWTLTGNPSNQKCTTTITGDTYLDNAYIGAVANDNKWWIGTSGTSKNDRAFINALDGNGQAIELAPQGLWGGSGASRGTGGTLTCSNKGWQLLPNGTGNLAYGNISWETNGTLTVNGNIIAKSLTLSNSSLVLAIMNFTTYDSSTHGTPTNGTTVDEGEPILYGSYNDNAYLIPLLKTGTASTSNIRYSLSWESLSSLNTISATSAYTNLSTISSNYTLYYGTDEASNGSRLYSNSSTTALASGDFLIAGAVKTVSVACPIPSGSSYIVDTSAKYYPIFTLVEGWTSAGGSVSSRILLSNKGILVYRPVITSSDGATLNTTKHFATAASSGGPSNGTVYVGSNNGSTYSGTINYTITGTPILSGTLDQITISGCGSTPYTLAASSSSGSSSGGNTSSSVAVVNNLTSTSEISALSAALGKVLNDKIENIKTNILAGLSFWKGTEAELPSTKDPNTIYIIIEE